MVATVEIHEANGGTDGNPGSKTRVDGQGLGDGGGVGIGTDVRFATMDSFEPESTNPCIIPSADFNYSYWKQLFLDLAGTFTTVNNIRFYTDGTIGWACGTGGGLFVGTRDSGDNGVPMDTSYEVATGVQGTSGNSMLTDHARCATGGNVALASGYTSGSTLLIDSTDYSASADSNAVLLQVKLFTDATQGTQTDETLTFIYDEI